jgi:uncharacterized protein involved in exopolysaccharide biosynthesis
MLTTQQRHENPHFVRRALVRHWRLAGMVAAAVLLLALWGIMALPREYSSEARLFVRFGRENLTLDPAATHSPMIEIDESRENEINSLLKVLKSRAMLDRLVESLGAEYQRAVQDLETKIEVWAPRKSNIISVRCTANSPAQAQKITARLVEIYLGEAVRLHEAAASDESLANPAQHSMIQWQAAAARLGQEQDKLDIAAIDGQRQQIQTEIAETDAKLRANQSDLKTSEASIASLQDQIAALPKTLVPQETPPSIALDNVPATLLQLEAREQELASTRSDNHPQLLAVRQQLADLRATPRQQPSQRRQAPQATQDVNPSRQALELALRSEQSQAAAHRKREAALTAHASKLRGDLKQLDAQAASLSKLQQDVDLAEGQYQADKLEQARISRSLDDERISSLTVAQPANLPSEPAGPRRAYLLALGAIVASLSGLASALVAACFRRVLATGTDLERLWDLPLIGVLPRLDQRVAAAS